MILTPESQSFEPDEMDEGDEFGDQRLQARDQNANHDDNNGTEQLMLLQQEKIQEERQKQSVQDEYHQALDELTENALHENENASENDPEANDYGQKEAETKDENVLNPLF